jgi:Secretion system C-terminal sorting domain
VTALNVPEVANSITTAAALNGNDAANSANVNGTISGISWGAGSTMWIRWKDNNDNGTDALLAVDNFSLSRGTTTSTRNSLTAGNVRVFPNPAADNLTIQVAGRAAKTAVTVTDLMGRTVLKGTSALDGTFGLNALRAGQYILLVQDGNTLTSHKIVKQ